jgi:hypothetical protein
MTYFCYFRELGMSIGRSYRMRKIVENVDRMSDKHTVSDSNRASRPYARLLANIAPVAQADVPAVREHRQLPLDDAMFSNRDPTTVTRNVTNAGCTP